MVIAKMAGFILLVEAFNTQPFRRLPAFLANCFRHLVSRQQYNRVFGSRLPFPETHHFDVCLRCGAEVVEMAQHQPWLKNRIGLARLTYFITLPPPDGEHTQVAAAFQPDSAQVVIQLGERGRTAHFQVEPEVLVMSILHAQMPQRFDRAVTGFGRLEVLQALRAFSQVFGYAASGEDFATVGAGAVGFGFSRHRVFSNSFQLDNGIDRLPGDPSYFKPSLRHCQFFVSNEKP